MGGRAAEELIFHDPSTGASNDIEKATALAVAEEEPEKKVRKAKKASE